MDAPSFWYPDKPGTRPWQARALAPFGALYHRANALRFIGQEGYTGKAPIICVGNLVAGGSGKTPTAIAIAQTLLSEGRQVHFLTRGYGGRERGPVQVDITRHNHTDVGDEALLLAAFAPTWIAMNRVTGAHAAAQAGADVIIMDDGFQNHPSLTQACSLAVVDGERGFGNGQVIPAGPLREPVSSGLKRAHGVILVREAEIPTPPEITASGLPLFRARLTVKSQGFSLTNERVIAFAGIGHPGKFFRTVRQTGAELVEAIPFADHAPYSPAIIERMAKQAEQTYAQLITTEKDMVRIPADLRYLVRVVSVDMTFEDEPAVMALLKAQIETLK